MQLIPREKAISQHDEELANKEQRLLDLDKKLNEKLEVLNELNDNGLDLVKSQIKPLEDYLSDLQDKVTDKENVVAKLELKRQRAMKPVEELELKATKQLSKARKEVQEVQKLKKHLNASVRAAEDATRQAEDVEKQMNTTKQAMHAKTVELHEEVKLVEGLAQQLKSDIDSVRAEREQFMIEAIEWRRLREYETGRLGRVSKNYDEKMEQYEKDRKFLDERIARFKKAKSKYVNNERR